MSSYQKETKVLYFSTQSTSGTLLNGDWKSKVSYDLHNYINYSNDPTVEYISASVPYACITNSNYIINETNNRLIVSYDGVNDFTYAFPHGNYTATSFISMFRTIMPTGFDLALDPLTKKYSIKYTSEFYFRGTSTIDYVIGFSTNITATYTSNALFGGVCWNIVCPRVCNFLPVPRFYIRCDEMSSGIVLAQNSQETSNVLASIPNVSKNNSQVVYENNMEETILQNFSYPSLTISITDENNNLINFNGVSSFFAIRFNIYRKTVERPPQFSKLMDTLRI